MWSEIPGHVPPLQGGGIFDAFLTQAVGLGCQTPGLQPGDGRAGRLQESSALTGLGLKSGCIPGPALRFSPGCNISGLQPVGPPVSPDASETTRVVAALGYVDGWDMGGVVGLCGL